MSVAKKQYRDALAGADELITIAPGTGYWLKALALRAMGEPRKTVAEVVKRAGGAPGMVYRYIGQVEKAEETYRQDINRNSDYTATFLAHIGLCVLYAELNRMDQARQEAAEALRMSPRFSVELWRERSFYKNQKDTEEAVAAFRKAGLK